jgi:hypothetical protein
LARSTPRGHPWAAGAENIVRIVAAEMVLLAGTANSRSVTETQCPPPRFGFVKVLGCRLPGGFDKRILEAPQEAAERARPPGKGREADQSLDRARPAAHGQPACTNSASSLILSRQCSTTSPGTRRAWPARTTTPSMPHRSGPRWRFGRDHIGSITERNACRVVPMRKA